jgi:hypothetical protein
VRVGSFEVDYSAQLSLAMDGNDRDMHFPRMSRRPEGSVAAPLALEAAFFASITHISNISSLSFLLDFQVLFLHTQFSIHYQV